MLAQTEKTITCPYCWESIEILIDATADKKYIEDCQVCCRPISIEITILHNSKIHLEAKREND
jgi:hypothetical protein